MTLQTDYSKAFSYARMQNGMPAVRSVILRNSGRKALTEKHPSIQFDPTFSEGHKSYISERAPKGKLILDHITVLPSASYLANLTERIEGRMTVFSSLQPEQITENGFVPQGVVDLKAFLKFARYGRETLDATPYVQGMADLLAEKIELRSQGETVHTAVGSSDFRVDIGVVDPDRPGCYRYGILLDGPGYASAQAARDREIIRPRVLVGLGWTLERQWILDRYED